MAVLIVSVMLGMRSIEFPSNEGQVAVGARDAIGDICGSTKLGSTDTVGAGDPVVTGGSHTSFSLQLSTLQLENSIGNLSWYLANPRLATAVRFVSPSAQKDTQA